MSSKGGLDLERILLYVIVFVVIVVFTVAAFLISSRFNRKKIEVFQTYVKQRFPDLPSDTRLLVAKQKRKTMILDIVLLLNEGKEEIIVILANRGHEMTHAIYHYKDLRSTEISDTVLTQGVYPKTYTYERTLKLQFNDGSSYDFIGQNISNKNGNDKGADAVKNIFAPFESKLKGIP